MFQSFFSTPGQQIPLTGARQAQKKIEKLQGSAQVPGPAGRRIWPFLATFSDAHHENASTRQADGNSFVT